jgi:oligoendopeptidase F
MSRKVHLDKGWIQKIIKVFSRANEESPVDLLIDIGLDVTKKSFWTNGTKSIEIQLQETKDLAKKLGKI